MRFDNYITEITKSTVPEVGKMLKKYVPRLSKALKTSKDLTDLCMQLTKIFDREKITFAPFQRNPKERQYDYVAAATTVPSSGEVYIELLAHENPMKASLGIVDPTIDTDIFLAQLIEILAHEFIHKAQFKKSKDPWLKTLEVGPSYEFENLGDVANYLACHYETEAWAHTCFVQLQNDMLEQTKSVMKIVKEMCRDKNIFKNFMKKLYYYCKKDKDAMVNLNKLVKGGKV